MEDVYEDREQRVERIELARLLYANAAANVNTAHTILLLGSVSACVIAELCGYSLAFLHRNECNPPIRVKLLHPVPNCLYSYLYWSRYGLIDTWRNLNVKV